MATNLHQFAKKNGVKYFFVSFVDLFGVLRSKLVPATAIDEIQSEGAEVPVLANSSQPARHTQRSVH